MLSRYAFGLCEKEGKVFVVSALIVCLVVYGMERLHLFAGTDFVSNVSCASD